MKDNGFVIITGASGSIGRAATKKLVSEGYKVLMACRNPEKATSVRDDILLEDDDVPAEQLEIARLDLTSRESIEEFVNGLKQREPSLKISALFNNAGVLSRDYSTVEGGLEKTMAVNYLHTALLTRLLLPMIEDGGNIVNMVSLTTKYAKLDLDWTSWDETRYGQLSTYASSKLALLYFSVALAKKQPRLHVNVSDPGVVNSNMITMHRWFDPLADILFRPFINSPEKGAVPALAALHSNNSLRYFCGGKNKPIPEKYVSSPLVDQLWEQADTLLGLSQSK